MMRRLLAVTILIAVMCPTASFPQASLCTVENPAAGFVNAASLLESDVQAAITAAGSTGKTVCLPAGTQAWTTPITNCYNGSTPVYSGGCTGNWVHIRGAGTMPNRGAATSGGTSIVDQIPQTTSATAILLRESADGNVSLSNLTWSTSDTFGKSGGSEIFFANGPVANGTSGAKVILMHHMTFNDGLSPNQPIVTRQSQLFFLEGTRGVWYRNQFLRSRDPTANGQAVFRCEIANNNQALYETNNTLGSTDTNGDLNLYFENNQVNNYAQALSNNAACRTVLRYNTGEDYTVSGHGRDTGFTSARHIEVYGNTFQCVGSDTDGGLTSWGGLRGGVQYWFNNTMDQITGSIANPGHTCVSGDHSANPGDVVSAAWIIQNRSDTGCYLTSTGTLHAYPAPEQFGWGWISTGTHTHITDRYFYDQAPPSTHVAPEVRDYAQDLEGSYIWNNYRPDGVTKINSNAVTNTPINDGGFAIVDQFDSCGLGALQSTYIQENREWYKQNDSFGGTTGIGIGPRASRPANCTTGTAWWATDQGGHWDTTSGNSNNGALDRCTATNTWTNNFYVPKVYPHPLATVGGGGGPSIPGIGRFGTLIPTH